MILENSHQYFVFEIVVDEITQIFWWLENMCCNSWIIYSEESKILLWESRDKYYDKTYIYHELLLIHATTRYPADDKMMKVI